MEKKILNIPVDEYASPIQVSGKTTDTVKYLKHLMAEKGYRHIPILENNKPIGIVTQRDASLISGLKYDDEFIASDIMIEDPYCVPSGTSIADVAFEMSNRKIGSALVLNDNGEAESIFTSIDGLNAVIEIVRGEVDL